MKFEALLYEIGGEPKYGEDRNQCAIISRKYNRREYILARRSLTIGLRRTFDQLEERLLGETITVWSGQLDIDHALVGRLICEGWIKAPSDTDRSQRHESKRE